MSQILSSGGPKKAGKSKNNSAKSTINKINYFICIFLRT